MRVPRPGARWLALALLAFVTFLYYRPLRTYVETRADLRERAAEVEALRAERRALRRALADGASQATLERAARQLGLVRPGERLFIVEGVEEWRHANRRVARR